MITNHSIEIEFVSALARINEQLERTMDGYFLPEYLQELEILTEMKRKADSRRMPKIPENIGNPLAKEI